MTALLVIALALAGLDAWPATAAEELRGAIQDGGDWSPLVVLEAAELADDDGLLRLAVGRADADLDPLMAAWFRAVAADRLGENPDMAALPDDLPPDGRERAAADLAVRTGRVDPAVVATLRPAADVFKLAHAAGRDDLAAAIVEANRGTGRVGFRPLARAGYAEAAIADAALAAPDEPATAEEHARQLGYVALELPRTNAAGIDAALAAAHEVATGTDAVSALAYHAAAAGREDLTRRAVAEAEARAEQLLEADRPVPFMLADLAHTAAMVGDAEAANRLLNAVNRHAEADAALWAAQRPAAVGRWAATLIELGDADAAVEVAAAVAAEIGPDHDHYPSVTSRVIEDLAESGDVDAARAYAQRTDVAVDGTLWFALHAARGHLAAGRFADVWAVLDAIDADADPHAAEERDAMRAEVLAAAGVASEGLVARVADPLDRAALRLRAYRLATGTADRGMFADL